MLRVSCQVSLPRMSRQRQCLRSTTAYRRRNISTESTHRSNSCRTSSDGCSYTALAIRRSSACAFHQCDISRRRTSHSSAPRRR
ncbi:hypothetical protein DAEQUDRAFT_93304 [Daedalea quercina L-15889]|uniref:Uncharacterized protein n=1 Tax=Daedalea quercina L-15889 TaxID=1314783 RepID=A0A165S9C9_9APHY|nr:hypothetical protein DAEQUDRAFT_93304 [Daedalea quercina L-15889]